MVTDVDPVLVEIVEGTLASIEAEVEDQIGRTSRSPMIRDQHDFRAGIHDRRLRKLTGRSYSALVHPVVRDFPVAGMRPGDVYFHNDVYLSEAASATCPTCASPFRSSTRARWWRSCRRSATTTTSAGPSRGPCRRTRPRCSRKGSWCRR